MFRRLARSGRLTPDAYFATVAITRSPPSLVAERRAVPVLRREEDSRPTGQLPLLFANSSAGPIASCDPFGCTQQRWKQQAAAARRRPPRTCAIAQSRASGCLGPHDPFRLLAASRRALTLARLQSCRSSCALSAARFRIAPNAGARDGRRIQDLGRWLARALKARPAGMRGIESTGRQIGQERIPTTQAARSSSADCIHRPSRSRSTHEAPPRPGVAFTGPPPRARHRPTAAPSHDREHYRRRRRLPGGLGNPRKDSISVSRKSSSYRPTRRTATRPIRS